jgi:hypothetical protein
MILLPCTFSLLHGKMKPESEQNESTPQIEDFQRNSAETMEIYPEIENMILEARTI